MAHSSKDSSQHRKLALTISNGNYSRSENRLDHAERNGRELAHALRAVDFDVTAVSDVSKHEMTTSVIDFAEIIEDGDLVLFYFCGHGCQTKGETYLIPVGDNQIETQDDIDDFAIHCEGMLERLVENNRSYVTVVIFDCSKPYLLRSTSKSSSLTESEGLNQIKPPAGAFIQFACTTNQTDSDNIFIKHLLKNIAKENVNITDMFRRITEDVYRESGKKQKPLSMSGLRQHPSVCLNRVIVPVQEWDEIKPTEMQSVLKKQSELKACYDNFPDIEELTRRNKPSIAKAEQLTQSILSETPSGNVREKVTACHVIYKLFEQEGQQCLFFDSSNNMTLHDASGSLADLSVQDKPFVLKLNNLNGLGDKTYVNGGEHGVNAVETLQRALDQKQSHPVIDDIAERLAKAHSVNKKQILIKDFYVGSCGVVYTVDDLPRNVVKSLTDIPDKLKDQFEEFRSAKIHPLLYRPAFDISQFDERGNKTFSDQQTFEVGPPNRKKLYIQPNGWTRYGLQVLDRYESKEWLHPFGHSGNWYKAYHGTGRAIAQDFGTSDGDFDKQYAAVDAAANIHKTGFREARIHVHGEGVYCSPNPAFPEKDYVGTVPLATQQGRKNFKCMLQVAVNPDGVQFTTVNDIWLVQKPKDIRTYGILIKEV